MLMTAATETKLYSTQKSAKYMNTSAPEHELVLGMYLRMGLAQMPNARAYWEEHFRYPLVADVMARSTLERLMKNIHFIDNESISDDVKIDKLWKI